MALVANVEEQPKRNWRATMELRWSSLLHEREEQVFLLLSLLIGALTGLAVVAFIVLTERWECASIRWAAPRGGVC